MINCYKRRNLIVIIDIPKLDFTTCVSQKNRNFSNISFMRIELY